MKTDAKNTPLTSFEEWKTLSPFRQGYILYMQGARPKSPLRNKKNPYETGTREWKAFQKGEQQAVLAAQDSEE